MGSSTGPIVPTRGSTAGAVTPVRGGGASRREPQGLGVRVVLSAIAGLTSPRVLERPYYFQCAPVDSVPRDYSWTWDEWVTLDGVTHSNPTAIANPTYSFSSLIVDHNERFVLVDEYDVLKLVDDLRKIGDTMRPFQLQFGQPALWGRWDVVTAATLRSLHIEERHPEIDARYFTVAFAAYADVDVPLRAVPIPSTIQAASVGAGGTTTAAPSRPGVAALLDSSTLPPEIDTLAKISKVYYKDPGQWALIAKASGLTGLSANTSIPDTVGQQQPAPRIVIPEFKVGMV